MFEVPCLIVASLFEKTPDSIKTPAVKTSPRIMPDRNKGWNLGLTCTCIEAKYNDKHWWKPFNVSYPHPMDQKGQMSGIWDYTINPAQLLTSL